MSTAPVDDASYAEEVARLLWPAPWSPPVITRTGRSHEASHRDAFLFPSEKRARLLVPAGVPGAASMLQRLGRGPFSLSGPLSAERRAGRMVERSLASRTFARTRWPRVCVPATDPDAESIETHLSDRLGEHVRVGVLLGTRRANQKPVLQVFDHRGGLLAYAKVGHNELTTELVRSEARALRTIGQLRPRSFEVPHVLDHGRWSGLEVLVLSPLTTDRRLRVTDHTRLAATRELTDLTGRVESSLAVSAFWSRLRAWSRRLATGPVGHRLHRAMDAMERRHGGHVVQFGARHGDWGSWNMGMGAGGVKIWDWERFDSDAPVGFDVIHFGAQAIQPGRRGAGREEQELLRSLPRLLAPLGVDPARQDLSVDLYLLEIGLRYVDALSHGPLPSLEQRTAWVVSLLERRITSSQHHPPRGPS